MRILIKFLVYTLLGAVLLSACAPVQPQGSATFKGEIAIGEQVSNATIQFTISEDGKTLEDLSIALNDLDCDFMRAELVRSTGYVGIAIENGGFSRKIPAVGSEMRMFQIKEAAKTLRAPEDQSSGLLSGTFSSPTQASGTIHLYIYITTWGAYELGTFEWNASVVE